MIEHRTVLQIIVLGAIVFLLIPHLVGADRVLDALRRANPTFIALAALAEIARYIASAASTRALARMFQRVVPMSPLVQAFFGGAAANRTFSTGGAPGMLVRLLCLKRYGVNTGGVAALFLIENINGLVIGIPILLIGIALIASAHLALPFDLQWGSSIVLGVIALVCIYLYTRRDWVKRIALWLGRGLDRVAQKIIHRPVFARERVLKWVNDFYFGMSAARAAPLLVGISLLMNFARYAAGMIALFLVFRAVNCEIAPDILILIYTSASFLTTLSAAPGEVAIMGSGIAILSLATGIPQEIAVTALLLSRGLAFWLPLPVGYVALWNMVRQGHL
jgi:uncharacterized protein (TIRG00374 family)